MLYRTHDDIFTKTTSECICLPCAQKKGSLGLWATPNSAQAAPSSAWGPGGAEDQTQVSSVQSVCTKPSSVSLPSFLNGKIFTSLNEGAGLLQ